MTETPWRLVNTFHALISGINVPQVKRMTITRRVPATNTMDKTGDT